MMSVGREPSSPPIAGDHAAVCGSHTARRSREITPLSAAHRARRSREITPPFAAHPSPPFAGDHAAHLWLNACRPASDSMPAGPHLTQCPPARRWLKPAGSPLTHARRIAADSWPPAAAIPSPVDQVHMSRPGVQCVCLVVPTGTF